MALQCARELGARSVTAIDINPQKLELAKALGATHTCNSREMTADDIQTALSDIQFDQLVLETAGTPQTVSLAIDIAGPRAQLALVGTLHHDLTLTTRTFGLILRKELTLLGSWMNYSAPWPEKNGKPQRACWLKNVFNWPSHCPSRRCGKLCRSSQSA